MKKPCLAGTVVLFGMFGFLTVGAVLAAAQGPAGAGAAAAAQETADTPHSLNPIKWLKKDPKPAEDLPGTRSENEQKLSPALKAQGLLPPHATVTSACESFTALDACLAVLHASHNLSVDFYCLRAAATGVHTSLDLSGCKLVDEDKALGLTKGIHEFKPDANAKQATRDAEQQAADDLKKISG